MTGSALPSPRLLLLIRLKGYCYARPNALPQRLVNSHYFRVPHTIGRHSAHTTRDLSDPSTKSVIRRGQSPPHSSSTSFRSICCSYHRLLGLVPGRLLPYRQKLNTGTPEIVWTTVLLRTLMYCNIECSPHSSRTSSVVGYLHTPSCPL